jgi:hypothetical protein
MSPDPTARQDLSWRQLSVLRHEFERDARSPNSATVFGLPGLQSEELMTRLSELVSQQDSLRVTGLSGRDGGSVTYAGHLAPAVRNVTADSVGEARSVAARLVARPFARDSGPLWELCIIEHPDPDGRPYRTACAVFDQLITDGRSLFVFQQALLADGGRRAAQSGCFRDWVRWQRRRFSVDRAAAAIPEREFWLRYLDGTPPERPVRLPFWSDGPLSGVAEIIRQELPADTATLAAVARRLRVTPFSLFLAAVASAISSVSGADDITLIVHVTGRRPGYLDTLGPFGEALPIRLRHAALADRRAALAAARDAWISTLPFQATPWDYIRTVCTNANAPSADAPSADAPSADALSADGPSGSGPHVVVNFVPWAAAPLDWQFHETQNRVRMSMSTLQISAAVRADSSYILGGLFDPGRYKAAGVRELLDLINRNWRQYLTCD